MAAVCALIYNTDIVKNDTLPLKTLKLSRPAPNNSDQPRLARVPTSFWDAFNYLRSEFYKNIFLAA